jgi:hypothetical protein
MKAMDTYDIHFYCNEKRHSLGLALSRQEAIEKAKQMFIDGESPVPDELQWPDYLRNEEYECATEEQCKQFIDSY